ncbi:MAG: hypothetical protein GY906_23270 [bacterium]|nr:hypothetical protein [bacterium]
MTQVVQALPTFFGGVSTQPPQVRRPNQVEAADNALMSVVSGGFEKRPATQTTNNMSDQDISGVLDTSLEYAVHFIDRDPTEQNVVLIGEGTIHVFDAITGIKQVVTIADQEVYYLIDAGNLDATGPLQIAGADMSEKNAIDSTETEFVWSWQLSNAAVVFDLEGSVDGVVWNAIATGLTGATGTTTTTIGAVTSGDHNYIRANVTTSGAAVDTIVLSANFKSLNYLIGTVVETIAFTTVADFTFISNRELNTRMRESQTGTVFGAVQTFNDLPAAANTGDIYKIIGSDTDGFTDFYVVDTTVEGSNVWFEAVRPDIPVDFDASTMPHRLIRNADGTWTFQQGDWGSRTSGDLTINPDPGFIGRPVTDLAWFRKRLTFVADEEVIASRIVLPNTTQINFFPEKSSTQLDTDPIERSASTTKVTLLKWATVFRKLLFATAETAQFELGSGDVVGFTPGSASFDLATSYDASPNAKPKALGDTLYFASISPSHGVIFEYFFSDASLSNTAIDVSKHIQGYIPNDIIQLATDPISGTLLVLTTGENQSLYVYRTFFDNDEKIQSAWARYIFAPTDAEAFIHGFGVLSGFIVLVIQRQDGEIYLEQMPIDPEAIDEDLGFIPQIDQREVPVGVYDATFDFTEWTLTYEHQDDMEIILGGAFSEPGRRLKNLVYPDRYDLTLASVAAGETIVIDGTTFTADATTTTPALREFSIAGADGADATELAVVVNDPTFGATRVTAGASGAVVNLSIDDPITDPVLITPTGTAVDNTTITVNELDNFVVHDDEFDDGQVYAGRGYKLDVELSKIFFRESNGTGRPRLAGDLTVHEVIFSHTDTGYYQIEVTPQARDLRITPFTGRELGDQENRVGVASIQKLGEQKASVADFGAKATIKITNDSPWPSRIASAEWRGNWTSLEDDE